MIARAIEPTPIPIPVPVTVAVPVSSADYRLRAFGEDDVLRYRDLLNALSPHDVRMRFYSAAAPSSPEEIRRALLASGSLGAVLVESLKGELLGVAHAAAADAERRGEFGLVVAAGHRRRGLGGAMADALLRECAVRGVSWVEAYTAWENRAAGALLRSRAFRGKHVGGGLVRWERRI